MDLNQYRKLLEFQMQSKNMLHNSKEIKKNYENKK